MRLFIFLLFGLLLVGLSSCRNDFETVASNGKLSFSKDTVYLDTVFSSIRSGTYKLKVYNKSKNDILIPSIRLSKGLASEYRMTVDGMTGTNGKLFSNVTLLANDSLFVFIETTVKSAKTNPNEFLYTDDILFDSGSNTQKVAIVTLVKEAIFLYPKKKPDGSTETILVGDENKAGFYLDENDPENGNELKFTKNKPYVIYGYAGVADGKTVTFDAGAQVYFHANSGLVVGKNASLKINGSRSTTDKQENEVLFSSDRLQPDYNTIPGQWEGIWLTEASTNNQINHLTLKNATIGLKVAAQDGTTLDLKNTQLYNCSLYGIFAQATKIAAENTVVNNAGLASLACVLGGEYRFTHCTFNNNWSRPTQTTVLLSNYIEEKKASGKPQTKTKDLAKATFENCIVYGTYTNAFVLDKKDGAVFNYFFANCLMKYNKNTTNPDYLFFSDPLHYTSIVLNEDPLFFNVSKNKFNIDGTSAATAKGNPLYVVAQDIDGVNRTLPPDLGAFQNKPFPKTK